MPDVFANDIDLTGQLYEWLEYWQPILRLQDWNITVNVRRRYDMSDHDVLGRVHRHTESKDAYVEILSTQDVGAHQKGDDADYEVTLLHELLHIHFAFMNNDEDAARQLQEELIINTLTRVLLKFKRDGLPS